MDYLLLLLALIGWAAGAALIVLAAHSALLFAAGARSTAAPPSVSGPLPQVTVVVSALSPSPALEDTLRRANAIGSPGLNLLLALGEDAPAFRTRDDLPLEVSASGGEAGKAGALNAALPRAHGEFLLFLDEDSRVDPGCLETMLPCFRDERVWAVVGEPYASNAGAGVIQRTLAIESAAWTAGARAKDRLGLFLPATGFFALVRKASLPEGRVWDEASLAEDADLSLRQEGRGFRARLSSARVGIEAPSSLADVARQRLRWYKGMFDSLWKNRGVVVRLPPAKAADATLTLLSPLGPAAFVVLLALLPVWPAVLGPILAVLVVAYLASSWMASSKLERGRLGVVLFSVPYALVQGGVALAALAAFLIHVKVKWRRTPKTGDARRAEGFANIT